MGPSDRIRGTEYPKRTVRGSRGVKTKQRGMAQHDLPSTERGRPESQLVFECDLCSLRSYLRKLYADEKWARIR